MSLVNLTTVLQRAQKDRWAVGAFNCNNLETLQAIIEAAEAEAAPVVVQASQGAIKYARLNYIAALALEAARQAAVPVVVHLDHGLSFEQAARCVRFGFSSVMIDGSKLPTAENAALTRRVVELGKAVGVSVEGELGRIPGTEDQVQIEEHEALFTHPEEAHWFVEETQIDALAVAVGTAHGVYKGTPRLDFKRLEKIQQATPVPLVLHGSSGVPAEALQEAISLGVAKINIDTDIRAGFTKQLRAELIANPAEIDPRKILAPAREEAVRIIREKIRLFGSSGKAKSFC